MLPGHCLITTTWRTVTTSRINENKCLQIKKTPDDFRKEGINYTCKFLKIKEGFKHVASNCLRIKAENSCVYMKVSRCCRVIYLGR